MISVGSVCSGIEAASVAWEKLPFKFQWFSEIAEFPSAILRDKYPNIDNVGDMEMIPNKLSSEELNVPDIICGGTPCQAFSLAGLKNGLADNRGNLTLRFVDIIDKNDSVRSKYKLEPTIVLWENVEGVLSDKTNAFGCFISALAGIDDVLKLKWSSAGILRGSKRNIAWRVIDAKYFGIPQQRKRVYLLAGGKDFYPENILFEEYFNDFNIYPNFPLTFIKEGKKFQVFREYTDCLYSAYGTKWNGNAAAYNGSLFVVQDDRIRRYSPIECERLMGFPDNYTNINDASKTNRYKAIGNSWAVPVVRWIGERLISFLQNKINKLNINMEKIIIQSFNHKINTGTAPNIKKYSSVAEIITAEAPDDLYISPVGCYGILRRKNERNIKINEALEIVLNNISSKWSSEDIEKKSLRQKRSTQFVKTSDNQYTQLKLDFK